MKISQPVRHALHMLYMGAQGYQEFCASTLAALDAYGDEIDLRLYQRIPAGVFGEMKSNLMRLDPKKRERAYAQRLNTATEVVLNNVNALALAELECKAFHTARGHREERDACNKRLTDIAKVMDELRPAPAFSMQQIEDNHLGPLERKHAHFAAKGMDGKYFETQLLEQTLTRYLEAAKAFVQRSDVHAGLIVIQLSENPASKGDVTHLTCQQAMQSELDCSQKLSAVVEKLFPQITELPNMDYGSKGPARKGLHLN